MKIFMLLLEEAVVDLIDLYDGKGGWDWARPDEGKGGWDRTDGKAGW
jgi:hypothetical protein